MQTPAPQPAKPGADGPPERPPADLTQVPDAEPRLEPIKPSGPNKPYVIEGETVEPLVADTPFRQRGLASWYGAKFHGRRTASGEIYSMYGMSAAHRTLPIPSYVRVRSQASGKVVIVRVNDRGPFHPSRVLDLSYAAAAKLDLLGRGVVEVEIERITFDDIRTGRWRQEGDAVAPPVDAAPAPAPAASFAAASATQPRPAPGQVSSPAQKGSDAVYALAARLDEARPRAAPGAVSTPIEPQQVAARALPESSASAAAQAPAGAPDGGAGAAAPLQPAPPAPPAGPVGIAAVAAPAVAQAPAKEAQARAYTPHAKGFWVQLAAFSRQQGVEAFQQRAAQDLPNLAPLLAVFHEGALYRLQVGPYARRDEAQAVAQRVRDALQLVPMVVERK